MLLTKSLLMDRQEQRQRKKNEKRSRSRKTRSSKKHHKLNKTIKGGSYTVPIRDLPDHYSIRFINAHGEISPEIFYIVPDKTYLIMPNVCGVPTHISQTFTDPLYIPYDEALKSFRNKFVELTKLGDTSYTVFLPGDIIPMQTFQFDPSLPYSKEEALFGFVGVFAPSVFSNNLFIQNMIKFKMVGADNVFSIPWKNINILLFEILEYIRLYLNTLDKDRKGRPNSEIFRIYKTILDKISGVKTTIKQSLEEDTRLTFTYGIIFENAYTRSLSQRINYDKIKGINLIASLQAIRYLLPLIPENMINELISEIVVKDTEYKLKKISINQIVEKTRDPSVDNFFIINSCRSLRESTEPPQFNFTADEKIGTVTTAAAAASASASTSTASGAPNNKYKKIDFGKYSAKLISKLNSLTLQNNTNPLATINMKKINELLMKKGFKKNIQTVVNYSELYKLFKDVMSIDEPGEEFLPMIESIKQVLFELEEYAPKETLAATRNVAHEADTARLRAMEISFEERKKELERLIRERKRTSEAIREHKMRSSKLKTANDKTRATVIQEQLQQKLEQLKQNIEQMESLKP